MIPPRFVRAVNSTRPYGAHRFDLFGPKIGRRLTLFGRRALDLWVRYVAGTNGKLILHLLPGYAPDLNPDELVWSHVKRTASHEIPCARVKSSARRFTSNLHGFSKTQSLCARFTGIHLSPIFLTYE